MTLADPGNETPAAPLDPRPGLFVARKGDAVVTLPPILTELDAAEQAIGAWPGYSPTPLRSLPGLAAQIGIGGVLYKDEAERFGLGSFKALGGAYAVERLLARLAAAAGRPAPRFGTEDAEWSAVTVASATDGNHGRSVAWGARQFGCRCVIYIHAEVSAGRAEAIARYGAEVRRVPGNYDDAVRQAARDAEDNGWYVVSDTSYPGYVEIPRDVMQGYGVMVAEAARQCPPGIRPTHVFVQGGVGGLAAAVCATLRQVMPGPPIRFVVVEPDRADCLFRSAIAGHPVVVTGALDTVMAGLACGEVSLIAWDILSAGADAFMTIDDEAAVAAMRQLAAGVGGDRPIVAGESAVAGLAALSQAAAYPDIRAALNLGPDSVALLFGTEGATDPVLYTQLVGRSPEEVATA